MQIALSEEQELIRATFAKLFEAVSSPEAVRAAEPLGFDAGLWKQLVEAGLLEIRVPGDAGGSDASLLDAAVVVYEAGRKLVSGPLLEAIVSARLLAQLTEMDGTTARETLSRQLAGEQVISLAFRDVSSETSQTIAGGAVADAVVAQDGDRIVLLERPEPSPELLSNVGSAPLAVWDATQCRKQVLATGAAAVDAFRAGLEEWKILCASALAGAGREALEIAGRYSCERFQFGRPIGAFQGVAHPLAESAAEIEGARVLVWKAIWAIAQGDPKAAALGSMSFAWAVGAAKRAVERALHTHGGYGLSLEYDIQLYWRRVKSLALCFGDPEDELGVIADRLWGPESEGGANLPEAGEVQIDFGLGASANALAARARRFFEENLDDELREKAHFAWEGHDTGLQMKLAEAGLLFPSWPREYGGQDADPYEMAALYGVLNDFGWTNFAISTTSMVGASLMKFGSDELKAEVLPEISSGRAIASLGYSEPGAGSDVAAAETRALRDGDEWVINGQKMFTSGANIAQYVFLLTRTNPDVKKHAGLTMFLVPLDTPGIDIQAVHTLSDERTNLTYYTDVRIPDHYRVGEVEGGWDVLAYALELEHGGGYPHEQAKLVEGALAWARETNRGDRPALEHSRVRERIARAAMHAEVAQALGDRALCASAEGESDQAIGPMARILSTGRLIEDSSDLMDLCAPDSLRRGREGGQQPGAEAVEFRHRLATATAVYAGTTEIMKSIIAQASLGMPRSRS